MFVANVVWIVIVNVYYNSIEGRTPKFGKIINFKNFYFFFFAPKNLQQLLTI